MNLMQDDWLLERIVVGSLLVNCYLVGWKPSKELIIVDPGEEPDRILEAAANSGFKTIAVLNTHGHGDHIGCNAQIIEATSAPLLIGRNEAELLLDSNKNMSAPFGMSVTSPPADRLLDEGDTIEIGDGRLRVFDAPGHSPGSIILAGDGFALVGDVLFAGSIGRTDFPGGSLELLLRMIREKIYPLGDECIIMPGHGPESTVGIEKRSNPFLQEGFNFVD